MSPVWVGRPGDVYARYAVDMDRGCGPFRWLASGPGVSRSRGSGSPPTASVRRLARALSVASVLAVAVSACGGPGSGPFRPGSGPLVAATAQKGFVSCEPAPNPDVRSINRWNSPIGFALDTFVNVSRSPLTVESVSLIDPHGLVAHGAIVYEMAHSMHPLDQEDGWSEIGTEVPQALWTRYHHAVPAVIPAGYPASNFRPSYKLNLYEIVPDVTATSPNGGWALGEEVTYKADGQTYTVKAYTGYAISHPSDPLTFCDVQRNAIESAFFGGS
jgi:hypothetical protein